jgi:hypothetical protein
MRRLLVCVLFAACVAAPVPDPERVPPSVGSLYGPIPVRIEREPTVGGELVDGLFVTSPRQIILRAGTGLPYQKAVLVHEECHVALTDFGVELESETEERVCNALMWHSRLRRR